MRAASVKCVLCISSFFLPATTQLPRRHTLSMDEAAIAQQTFELENNVVTLDPATDAIFHYNNDEQRAALNDAPWRRE